VAKDVKYKKLPIRILPP